MEDVAPGDGLKWWHEQRATYPCLPRMALDYLNIPGMFTICLFICYTNIPAVTSINVEWLFSKGCVVLPYLHNCLLSQSTHALLCLGQWSKLGLIKDEDLRQVICEDLEGDKSKVELPDGWDKIHIHM
jgi:hAT family C-terminal dimerisation region